MTTMLTVTANVELDPWTDVDVSTLIHNAGGVTAKIARIGVLPNATHDGRASVSLLIILPDGTPVIAETTLRLFNTAAVAIAASPVAQMEDL